MGMPKGTKLKPRSAAFCAQISARQIGRKASEETRARISAAKRGKPRGPVSRETRAKISAALIGRTPAITTRAKIGAASLIHGHHRKPTYVTWQAMRARCNNPKHDSWKFYGGKGITVCARWNMPQGTGHANVGFQNFLADMGERPPGTVIDRIDSSKNYEPGNCCWTAQIGRPKKAA